jgi:uncharacterized protein YaaN involved in tellurite resistance
MADELIPPEGLEPPEKLTPPKPVGRVDPSHVEQMLPLSAKPDPATLTQIDARVQDFVDALTETQMHTEAFANRMTTIHNLGTQEIRDAANVSNRMLNQPVRAMDDDSEVSTALLSLRRTVEDLNPARQETPDRRVLGIFPRSKGVSDYFRKYQSAQSHIDAVLNALHQGQDELRKDVASIEQEKANLWGIMGRLQEVIHATRELDRALTTRLTEIEATDPAKARIVKEEVLFYVRQKQQDLMTQLAVSVQGYLALDVIRRNNLELIKGVERATTTTISALRTAVIVAQALSNQKLVLDQITALNTTTGSIIASTSELLKTQSGHIHEQAAAATVGIEQLQTAFDNVFQTLDMISNYKIEALDTMSKTIGQLSSEVTKATTHLDRVRTRQAIETTGDILPPSEGGRNTGR